MPKPGSIMETMCLLVQARRERARLFEVQSVVQAVLSSRPQDAVGTGEEVQKTFDHFKENLMPPLQRQLREREQNLIKALKAEVARGPLTVHAVTSLLDIKSKLRQRAEAAQQERKRPRRRRR